MPVTPMEYALRRIQEEIPAELLSSAFKTHQYYGAHDTYSLEQLIQNRVLDNIVFNDCAMLGGRTAMVPIYDLNFSNIDAGDLFIIPLSRTNGRHIISVEGVEQGYAGMENLSIPHYPVATGSSQVELVGPNTVLVRELSGYGNTFLRCRIEESRTLQDYSPRVMPLFGDMCVEAAKMAVFNSLNIKLGDASTNGGTTNQYLRSALDQFSDAVSVYRELRDRWGKVSIMQDPMQTRDLIRQQLL